MKFQITTRQGLLALVCITYFLGGCLAVMQDDSWWHLATGRLIANLGYVPLIDSYSFTLPQGTYWPNHEWLFQLIQYLLFQVGGLPLCNVVVGCICSLVALLLFDSLNTSVERRVVILAAILPWIVADTSVRPHIVTLLGVSLTFWLVIKERYRYLPILFLIWANMHAGVAFGGAMLILGCVASTVLRRDNLRSLLIATIASGLAVMLNPLTYDIFLYPLRSISHSPDFPLHEWMPPGFSRPEHLYFWIAVGGFLGLTLFRFRSFARWPNAWLWLVTVLAFYLGVSSERHIPLAFISMSVLVGWALLDVHRQPPSDIRSKSNGIVVALYSLIGLVALGASFARPIARLSWEPMSDGVLQAIERAPSPMFNSYNSAGFILWKFPDRKVFIDSRLDPYPYDFAKSAINVLNGGEVEFFDRYDFHSAVMESNWPLSHELRGKGWRVVYEDSSWVVLYRG